jgi:alkaline phosphatase D
MPHYAIWDDHDYGPNDIGSTYILKEESKKVFDAYFCNPSSGENGQGTYTMNSYGDADIFMTDDRWWRSPDRLKDSIDGKPNPDKIMFGKQQMTWLKNALLHSNASFKIIAVGSQVLNPVSNTDKFLNCPIEYEELMNFIKEYKINGVLFLTGDRHHSEIIKVERPGHYPLYDITVSPLTSGTHKFGGPEKNNPYRILGIDEKQNYGKITVTGKRNERKLAVEFLGTKGEKLGEWSIMESELKSSK